VSEGASAIKRAVNVPVIGKIDPQKCDVVASALAMQRGGTFAIDIFNGGKSKVPATKKAIFMTIGAPYKPFAQGFVARVAQAVNVPILGSGGLMDWQDVVEMIMFGASAVSFCTLLLLQGFEAITNIEKSLRTFMEKQGYNAIGDFKGLALGNIAEDGSGEIIPSLATIDKEKCTGCGICLKPAHCLATFMENGKAKVNETECLGCGVCTLLCPAGAVSMVEI
jgi:dihydropyrimidine dehydrogenase (NAD+) subunit PreA